MANVSTLTYTDCNKLIVRIRFLSGRSAPKKSKKKIKIKPHQRPTLVLENKACLMPKPNEKSQENGVWLLGAFRELHDVFCVSAGVAEKPTTSNGNSNTSNTTLPTSSANDVARSP